MRLCSVDGCERGHEARGLCHYHYNRWQRDQPAYRERERATDRKWRNTDRYRTLDRERQRLRRLRNGQKPRSAPMETALSRRAKRKQAKLLRARRKLERAALGTLEHRTKGPRRWVAGACPGCREPSVRRAEVCSKTCRKRVDRWADRDAYGNYRERARRFGVIYEPVRVEAIMRRDSWVCQLCGIRTDGVWPAPTSPSLDHIIPMARGGDHTWDNLQCACLCCNSRKGATVGGGRGEGTVQQLVLAC